MSSSPTRDYFDKARAIAATIMFAAGAVALVGAVLDWLVVEEVPPNVPADQAHRLPPFSGTELGDGYVVIGAAVVAMIATFLVVLRRGSGAWLAFLGFIVIGGIAISDYRGIQELHRELEAIGGNPRPGLGLTLVAIAGFVGFVGSVGAIAASPKRGS